MVATNLPKHALCVAVSLTTSTRPCDHGLRMRSRFLWVIAALLTALAIASTAGAQQRFGSWFVTQSSEDATVFVAATVSSSGELLRKICGPRACLWMFTSKYKCQE